MAKSKSASKLFTIGDEKSKPDAVLAELKRAKVKLLVDTRAVAASRKPGFSKRQLAASLDEHGIAYLHLQKLGTPAEGREAARAGKLDTLSISEGSEPYNPCTEFSPADRDPRARIVSDRG